MFSLIAQIVIVVKPQKFIGTPFFDCFDSTLIHISSHFRTKDGKNACILFIIRSEMSLPPIVYFQHLIQKQWGKKSAFY